MTARKCHYTHETAGTMDNSSTIQQPSDPLAMTIQDQEKN